MHILNRYYMRIGFDEVWLMPVIGIVLALIGAGVAIGGDVYVAFAFLFVAVILALIYLLIGTVFAPETDIEVIECFFDSEEEAEAALQKYELIETRGYIHCLVEKEDIAE